MEHELLHNEQDINVKLTNKPKKEKEKIDPGERKKWNFRKTSGSDIVGKRSPSPTSGLINPSAEVRSKRVASPRMIFENQITDHEIGEQPDHHVSSPPIPINSPPTTPQVHTPPKSVSFDSQSRPKRVIQKTLSLSTSPPVIARPQPRSKPVERMFRQQSAPAGSPMAIHQSSKVNYQQSPMTVNESFSIPAASSQTDGSDLQQIRNTSNIPPNNQWKPVQQKLFPQTPEKPLQNVAVLNRQKITTDEDTPGGEAVDESSNIMWQGNKKQELIHGNWTDFTSISNEVFVPDDRAWTVAENIGVDEDENDQESPREVLNSSNSSNSSASGDDQEVEENVWKINEEQRVYYLNQFRVLQPAEKGVVTGQKARDFFLKSGLPTDVLSRIWNLADLDSDGALNFEEFCIAMHVVVAVRHGLEVPTTLPLFLVPEQYERQVLPVSPQQNETNNAEQLPLPDTSPQTWARFSPGPDSASQAVSPEDDNTKVQPPAHVQPAAVSVVQQQSERPMSDPNSADESTPKEPARKTSVGIPRLRGTAKQTSLLDQPHWAILPPPSKFAKETDDTGKSVPIGTIIPDDTPDKDDFVPQLKVENVDRPSPRDSQSDSSSNEEDQKERPKSLTKENLDSVSSSPASLSKGSSHDSVGVSQDSVDGQRKSTAAPVPPPRKKTGHSRSSSLDLQKLFNNKGGSNSFQPTLDSSSDKSKKHKSLTEEVEQNNLTNGMDNKDSTEQSRDSQENFADFSNFDSTTVTHPTENLSRHRRSASLDSTHAIWVGPSPPQENNQDQVKDSVTSPQSSSSLPRPVPKKKPVSPPLPLRQKKDIQQQDSGSDSVMEKEKKTSKEPIHFVVKPLTRLEQLHARIRDLKTKNTILSRVNNELQQEFKEMMEKRVELESLVEQFKPLSNG